MLRKLEHDANRMWKKKKNGVQDCDAFVFLNDGALGPIVPSCMPEESHWTRAFLDKFTTREQGDPRREIGSVGTTIVCLPPSNLEVVDPKWKDLSLVLLSVLSRLYGKTAPAFENT